MKTVKVLVGVLILGVTAIWYSGCGSSSAGNGNSSVLATNLLGYTTCTSNGTTTTQCLPNLSSYVHFTGIANITNTSNARDFVRGVTGITPSASALTQAQIDVVLSPSSNGPSISFTITFPGFGPIQGFTSFIVSTTNSNPDVGTIRMDPISRFPNSAALVSNQPWDGTVPYLTSVTVNIDGAPSGVVGLHVAP